MRYREAWDGGVGGGNGVFVVFILCIEGGGCISAGRLEGAEDYPP